MKPGCILINPWVYDFSAVNLWSRPLGLMKVAEYLSRYELDLGFIDCMDVIRTKRKFGTGKYPRQILEKPEILRAVPKNYARYGMSVNSFEEELKGRLPCDIVFISSIMSYWYPGVQKTVEIVRSLAPDTPIILGGIYPTLYYRHAIEHSGADYVFRGHINKDIENAVDSFGIKLKKVRDSRPYYNLGLYQSSPFAPVLTGMGCPYTCSYCASSLLFNGFEQREPADVIHEIRQLYKTGVRDFAFYDDALLANADSHIKVVLKEIIKSGLNSRFHCPNGIHARFIDDELAYLMKQSGFTTLRLGLETAAEDRQKKTGGKITTDIFRTAVTNLKRHGFSKKHIGVYLMYGLPGQQLDEVRDGVEFLKGQDVRINLTEFSPIPGTVYWQELKNTGVIFDDTDPLLTNNSAFSILLSGYDIDTLEELRLNVKNYNKSE